jgi:hypothetical protein
VKVDQLRGELQRLVLARSDIESADALLMLLVQRPEFPRRISKSSVTLGLWTGALVSYARPFTRSTMGLDERWSRFPLLPWLDETHQHFIKLRNQVFAHNDDVPLRSVHLVPPGGAIEKRARMRPGTVNALKRLCRVQLERIHPRIETLATELSRGQEWREGSPVDLAEIPSDLVIHSAPSPFQVPASLRSSDLARNMP